MSIDKYTKVLEASRLPIQTYTNIINTIKIDANTIVNTDDIAYVISIVKNMYLTIGRYDCAIKEHFNMSNDSSSSDSVKSDDDIQELIKTSEIKEYVKHNSIHKTAHKKHKHTHKKHKHVRKIASNFTIDKNEKKINN